MYDYRKIFTIESEEEFERIALELFSYQYARCTPYREYVDALGICPESVNALTQIPYLPISVFRHRTVTCNEQQPPEVIFTSSGTSGNEVSRHPVVCAEVYRESFHRHFEANYGSVSELALFALLPSYAERSGSSLIYMAEDLVARAAEGGFFLYDHAELARRLTESCRSGRKTILLGVAFALADMAESQPVTLPELIVMETGGMKSRRRELSKPELYALLTRGFGVGTIHSEYGMTELLSQAYSQGGAHYRTPPWMRVTLADLHAPLLPAAQGVSGRLNIIDLANCESCAFIATDDRGRLDPDGSFTVEGRIDGAILRGCNMLIE